MDWHEFTNKAFDIKPGTAVIGRKTYPHSFGVPALCNNASPKGIVFPTAAGRSTVDVSVGYRDTDTFKYVATAYLMSTTDPNGADDWTEIQEVRVKDTGLVELKGAVPSDATAFMLYSMTHVACGGAVPTFADGTYT